MASDASGGPSAVSTRPRRRFPQVRGAGAPETAWKSLAEVSRWSAIRGHSGRVGRGRSPGEVGAGVGAAALGPGQRCRRPGRRRPWPGCAARPRPPPRRAWRRSLRRPRRGRRDAAERRTPASDVIVRWRASRAPATSDEDTSLPATASRAGSRRPGTPRPGADPGAQHAPHGARRARAVEPGAHGLDHTGAVHHPVEQRVGRQAVGPVHAVARRLARHPQARQGRGAVEVGHDATAQVVRGRRHRQPVVRRVETGVAAGRRRWSGTGGRTRPAR